MYLDHMKLEVYIQMLGVWWLELNYLLQNSLITYMHQSLSGFLNYQLLPSFL